MPRVYNKHTDHIPHNAVYIGRPSKWGNPFLIGRDGDRQTVVARFRVKVLSDLTLKEMVKKELRGMNLVCFCSPEACHGDVLLEVANAKD
jgi:hypothetical protein